MSLLASWVSPGEGRRGRLIKLRRSGKARAPLVRKGRARARGGQASLVRGQRHAKPAKHPSGMRRRVPSRMIRQVASPVAVPAGLMRWRDRLDGRGGALRRRTSPCPDPTRRRYYLSRMGLHESLPHHTVFVGLRDDKPASTGLARGLIARADRVLVSDSKKQRIGVRHRLRG